ncbi:hypothetical protein CLV24_1263 [Pontibacter ummariensis]|uniref:Uncharacterized protein n=1 Tax=Pontibacter ummariensis TaxID=1610492 RepID=A0A239K7B8_9BACT|nr:hypothetical protein [Pontibacter ummariensis]PRY06737.1 hypothetical protein CLV24_1263 [Pontibacter ummariensis]SNT13582.1 hypothetical protein SAMN06296052_12650 [Pontibacter ummariensis]
MSAKSFQLLLETAYDNPTPPVFEEGGAAVYETFEKTYKASKTGRGKSTDELNFRFERLRLGVAIAFVKAFTRLADNEKSLEALQLLQEAIRAKNTKEIDKIIQKKIAAFDHLYHEIFVNEQREQLLGMFERTLDAGSKEELDELIFEGLELMQEIDWEARREEQDDDDDIEPLDEDFLKSL